MLGVTVTSPFAVTSGAKVVSVSATVVGVTVTRPARVRKRPGTSELQLKGLACGGCFGHGAAYTRNLLFRDIPEELQRQVQSALELLSLTVW